VAKSPHDNGSAPYPSRPRVLVVDDEPAILRAIERVLRREHDVITASSGAEALDHIESDPPYDCILCDITMPGMSGMEVYRRLEGTPAAARVVFVTAIGFAPASRAFLESVPNLYVDKPFHPDELRAAIRECLARTKQGG
jgi:CheY-like chemotaxis protein